VTDVTEQRSEAEQLAEANQRLAAHIDNSPLGVIEFDPQFRIVRWSGGAERLFGWAANEVIGRGVFDLCWVHEDDLEGCRQVTVDLLTHRRLRNRHHNRNYRKDGSLVHCEWYNSAIYDSQGRLASILSQVLDVSERKLGEEGLARARRAAEERAAELDAVLQAVPAAVWIAHDPECRRITGNRTADAWLRVPAGAEVSLTAAEGVRPTHFKIFQHGRELAGDELPVQRAARGIEVRDCEEEIVFTDGSVRPFFGNATPLWDEQGRPRGAVAAFVDITERKLAEEKLRLQLSLTAAISDCAADSIFVTDGAGRITFVNAEAERAFGFSSGELMAKVLHDVLHHRYPDGRPYPFAQCPNCVARGPGESVRGHEAVFFRKDGSPVSVVCSSSALEVSGEPMGAVLVVHDATNIKRAESDLREADRRKDEFLATLAHELRNPLVPIRNAVEVLRRHGPPDPTAGAAREMIERQARYMTRLVDDLLDLSRITRGRLLLRRESVELAAVLERAVEASRYRVRCPEQEISCRWAAESLQVDADPLRLEQVFLNLLDNARKYTGDGGCIRLTVERAGAEAVVTVSDTGIGIAPEDLPHVFDMFAQVGEAPERAQGGLGIGLSLARSLVELHGGRVEACSDGLGKGSAFVVRLPTLAERPGFRVPAPEDAFEAVRTPTLRILVADDNRDVAESLALLLRASGHEVETAQDGAQAVESAGRYRPDAVLLDIGMPRLDGYAACRRMREQPWGRDMIIVALTGWGQEEDRRRAADAGFNAHLVKPVDPAALLRLLTEATARGA
jgi:PAS domain S-box-containing protein